MAEENEAVYYEYDPFLGVEYPVPKRERRVTEAPEEDRQPDDRD